jgi:CDP-paratose 2-epimerase
VRDVLSVRDLVLAFDKVRTQVEKTAGQIYNVGGGVKNSVSLLEVIDLIEEVTGRKLRYTLHRPRPGDQLYYVTDYDKLRKHTGWRPHISVRENIMMIWQWWREQHAAPQLVLARMPESTLARAPEAVS